MKPKQNTPPKYQYNKATGRARVAIDGRHHYLGPYGSPESKREYDRLIAGWKMRQDGFTIRMGELALVYLEHAGTYYRKRGQQTSEVSAIKTALRFLEPDAKLAAVEFGPRKLLEVQARMIRGGIVRTSINKHIGRVRRMFRWGVVQELVPGSLLPALEAVPGIRAGRTDAAESEPVVSVEPQRIDAVRPFVSRPVWGLIQVQRFTGMRPGEALTMRWHDINTEPDVWEYRPDSHKTEHHGRQRVIFIGQRGQELLCEFIRADPAEYIFCPQDVRDAVTGADSQPGELYGRDAYRRAIRRACERAFGMPAELKSRKRKTDAKAWRRANVWTPNQLRHSLGTEVRSRFGLEAAQVVLGHSNAKITEVYAERDLSKARDVMREMG